jgi:hypothetical protein
MIELLVMVDDALRDRIQVILQVPRNSTFADCRPAIIKKINDAKLASETWDVNEDITVFWTQRLTNKFRKTDMTFIQIPGLIKEDRVTFRLEKMYPGGNKLC